MANIPSVNVPKSPLRWRLWWRFAFTPFNRVVTALPISEWRKEAIVTPVDFWAMDHIGRTKP